MAITINKERLASVFTTLCEIDSPSKKEGKIAAWLKETFAELGADSIYEDQSKQQTGSESGNLIITFNGTLPDRQGFFLCCHMDTVEPAEGVEVVRNGNIFTSSGDTILGADDKSGIAAIIELFRLLKETGADYPKIEVIITACEEIGLLGAKHLDCRKITTAHGYALDSCGINQVIVGAPAANKVRVEVTGLAAHAGICPELGINALSIAASALTALPLGRLDAESSRNFGVIKGGVAENIIPETIVLEGEVRSHSEEKLAHYSNEITEVFTRAVNDWRPPNPQIDKRPEITIDIDSDYPSLSLPEGDPVLRRLESAAEKIGKNLQYMVAGGGSDANIFCSNGKQTANIATGMAKVHTVDEQLDLRDLVELVELLFAMATVSC